MTIGLLLSQEGKLFALVCVPGLLAVAVAPAASATPASTTAGACGPIDHGHDVIAPTAVDMWKAPRDASGQHELILAVHRDGERFCYTYRWHGVEHTLAPAIHMRRGETFAIRLVNDIASPCQSLARLADRPCDLRPIPGRRSVRERFQSRRPHIRPPVFSGVDGTPVLEYCSSRNVTRASQ